MLFPSPGWYKRFSIQALMFVLLAAGSPVCVSAEAVRLGVLSPRPDVAETKRQWESIRSELEESLDGRDLVVEVFSLQGLERAVASRRVDFVLTSPGHYEMLLSRYGLSAPLATRVTRYEGQEVLDVIGGVMIVRNDNEAIQNLGDLPGKRVAMVDLASMGGYQMQAHALFEADLPLPDPADLVRVGTPHDRVIEAVLSGQAEVGFLRAGRLEQLVRAGQLAPDALRLINVQDLSGLPFEVSTRLYPEWPLASMPHTDSETARQMAVAALTLEDAPGGLSDGQLAGFRIPVDYSSVRAMLRDLRVAPFDTVPQMSSKQLLQRYWLELTVTLAAFLVLAALTTMLILSRRRLVRLREIVEHSPSVAISWRNEPGWPVGYLSRNIEQFGYSPDALTSGEISYASLIHPDDLAQVTAEVEQHFADGPDDYRQTYRLRHGAGHWIWIEDHTWLTRHRDGRVSGIHGVLMDVSERRQAELSAHHSRYLLNYVIEHARYAVAVHDRDLNYVYVSHNYLETFGIVDQDVIGKNHYEVFPELPQKLREVHQRVLQGEVLSAEDDPFVHPDGSVDWTRWECRPWFDVDGAIGGLIVYTEITTKSRQARITLQTKTEQLAESNERLQQLATVFTHAHEGVIITDAGGDIVEVNDAFTRITGYTRDEVLGRNPRFLRSGRHGPSFYRDLWQTLESEGYWAGEMWNRRKNGELHPQQLTISAVRDDSGQVCQYVSLCNEVSDIKQHEQQLEYATSYDPLTGLPNRRLLSDRIKQAMEQMLRRNSGLAVIYLDLDDFKAINERLGHDVGDRLLCQLTDNIQSVLRPGDLAGRLGGDELMLVLVEMIDRTEIEAMLGRLRDSITAPLVIGDEELRLSASLGVTQFPQPDEVDADQLLRQADQAMYRAKQMGKGRYEFFDREEDAATRGLHESRQRIRTGLEQGEFVLFYQPKVNMRSGLVIGAEALIRWQHPERGLLAPGQFLPLVENDDLALEMGQWVIEEALDQLSQWLLQGLEIGVSVNVFARQLQQEGFVDQLRATLARFDQVRPGHFEIEVLETSALADISSVSGIIEQCQAMGVECALDDFGTGYSSLSYLKGLPAAILKIDQSFVRDMLDDPEDLAILNGVLGLATAFERTPIAEGVETRRHGEILLDLGCELAQGYGIARPMPADQFPGWTADWRPEAPWRDRPLKNAAQLRLIFAMVEHRAWIARLVDAVDSGQRLSVPDIENCTFGKWLHNNAALLKLPEEEGKSLHQLHDAVHDIARGLLANQKDPSGLKTGPNKDDLYKLRDRLLRRLEAIEGSLEDPG